MIKRLNYTGRRRIRRKHVQIETQDEADGVASFTATLALDDYEFPANARVYVEAQRLTAFMRFSFGTVGAIAVPPADKRRLIDIGRGEGVTFRVKVVATSDDMDNSRNGVRPARVLGLADGIRPRESADSKSSSLLEIISGDTGDEVWRLEMDDSAPTLVLPPELFRQKIVLLAEPWFRSAILPMIFRSVLMGIMSNVQDVDWDDTEDWRTLWLRMAASLPGAAARPPLDANEAAEWIDDTVGAFCRQHDLRSQFEEYWNLEHGS